MSATRAVYQFGGPGAGAGSPIFVHLACLTEDGFDRHRRVVPEDDLAAERCRFCGGPMLEAPWPQPARALLVRQIRCPWCGSGKAPIPTDARAVSEYPELHGGPGSKRWLRANPAMCPDCLHVGGWVDWGYER